MNMIDKPGAWGVTAEATVWTYIAPSGQMYAIAKGSAEGVFRVSHVRDTHGDVMTLVLIGTSPTMASAERTADEHSWVWVTHWQQLPQDDPDNR